MYARKQSGTLEKASCLQCGEIYLGSITSIGILREGLVYTANDTCQQMMSDSLHKNELKAHKAVVLDKPVCLTMYAFVDPGTREGEKVREEEP